MKTWQKISIIALIAGLLGFLIFAVIRFSGKDDERVCNNVVITVKDNAQLHFITQDNVKKMLTKDKFKLKGEKINSIKISEIQKLILSNPAVRKADCYITPSADLKIDVWQREPLFRVSGTENYYVDTEGKILPLSDDFVVYVPIVTGNVSKEFAKGELMKFILFIKNNEFWNAQIEQIDVMPTHEIVLIPRVGNHEIELGKLENYESKLNKLQTFYLEGLNKIGWGDYKTISLKYKDQVVCTKR